MLGEYDEADITIAKLDSSNMPYNIATATSFPVSFEGNSIDGLRTEHKDNLVLEEAYRYYSPVVKLEPGFEAMQIRLQTDAILPTNTEMYVYYRIKQTGENSLGDYKIMTCISSVNKNNKSQLLEFDTQRTSTTRFKEFQVKIRFISSDYVSVPTLKNIRIIALDN